MDPIPLIDQAKGHVTAYFREHQNANLVYHTLAHTENAVAVARQIALHYRLSNDDLLVTLTATWFIDIGYYTDYIHHEAAGAGMAEDFLSGANAAAEIKGGVKGCLLATKLPQRPVTLPEKIVCDVAFFHLGTVDFTEQNRLMRRELSLLHPMPIDRDQWRKSTIQLMEQHSYQTEYCKKHLGKRKKDNLEKLRRKDAAVAAVDPITALLQSGTAAAGTGTPRPEKKKKERPEKTIETMFRITSANSQRLSDQADTKSHIMITVNSIIISVLLSILLRKLEENSNLIQPVILLLTVNVLTIVFSILATRPNIPKGTFTPGDLQERKVNLLFFGNFYRMNFDDYCQGMFQVMDDKNFLYLSLLRDIYSQGIVLGRKYRMLKTAYNIFMFGLILSVIAFLIKTKYQ